MVDRLQISAEVFSQGGSRYYEDTELQTVVDYRWRRDLGDDIKNALSLLEESAYVAGYKLGLCLMLKLPLKLRIQGRMQLAAYPTIALLRAVEFLDYCCEWKDVSQPLASFILDEICSNELLTYPMVYIRLACLLRSEELFKRSMLYSNDSHLSTPRDLGNSYTMLNATSLYWTWRLHRTRELVEQLCGLRSTDHPISTAVTATAVYRDWLVFRLNYLGEADFLKQFIGGDIRHVTDIFTQWKRRVRRGDPLPQHVRENQVVEKLSSLFKRAEGIIKDAFVQVGGSGYYELNDKEFFRNYVYPWQGRAARGSPSSVLSEALERTMLESWCDPHESNPSTPSQSVEENKT